MLLEAGILQEAFSFGGQNKVQPAAVGYCYLPKVGTLEESVKLIYTTYPFSDLESSFYRLPIPFSCSTTTWNRYVVHKCDCDTATS